MLRYIVAVLFAMPITSCSKNWLDIKPNKNLSTPSTLSDFNALINNTNVMNEGAISLGEVASDGHYVPESVVLANGLGNEERNAYTWSKEALYNNVYSWNRPYERVFYCNVILDGLNKIQVDNDYDREQFNELKASALFHRAWNNYNLVQLYAPSYDSITAASTLGIPLRKSSDITQHTLRHKLIDNYSQILNDLLIAKDLFSSKPNFKTRGSKESAFALLAKTYLVMGEYKKAGLYADSSLLIQNRLIDYNDLDSSAPYIGLFNDEVLFHCNSFNFRSTGRSLFIDTSLYKLYSDNDLRKTIFFNYSSGGITFKGRYNDLTERLFMGIATDEVYLILAEALVRQGMVEDGIIVLNELLKKRYRAGTFVPLNSTNPAVALGWILTERKKELLLRGIRWTDMKRLGRDLNFPTETVIRKIGDKTYTLEPNSFRYTFPIPDDIIERTGIQQNEGW